MAAHLGEEVGLIDVAGGVAGAAAGIEAAAGELGCDLLILADVGGDVLARGDEPGLASPLCDAVMVAAAARLAGRRPALLAVAGPGCDGELTADGGPRAASPSWPRAAAWIGTFSVTPRIADELDAADGAGAHRGQPADRRAAHAARWAHAPIRARPAHASSWQPLGAMVFVFDPLARMAAGRFPWPTRSPAPAASRRAATPWPPCGIHTELDYERGRAGAGTGA